MPNQIADILVTGEPVDKAALRAYLQRRETTVNVEDFGADPAGVTDSTAAIQAAIDALPALAGDFALGDVPIRAGAVMFGPGTYLISDTLQITAHTALIGLGTAQRSTTIKLADGTFTAAEGFLLEVLPSLDGGAGGTPSGNITFGPEMIGLYIDCNGQNNAFASGVKWYGCEMNRILRCAIVNVVRRGLVFNDRGDGYTAGNNTLIDSLWINGIGATAVGPGLDLRGNNFFLGDIAVQHFNEDGTFTDADADPVPAILMEGLFQSTIGTMVGEGESLFLKIKDSGHIHIGTILAGRTPAQVATGTTGVKITAATAGVTIASWTVNRMATALRDNSTAFGANDVTIAGAPADTVSGPYSQWSRVNWLGVGCQPSSSYPFMALGNQHRIYNDDAAEQMILLLEHTGNNIPGLKFRANGTDQFQIYGGPHLENALVIGDLVNVVDFAFRNGRFGVGDVNPQHTLDVEGPIQIAPGAAVTPTNNGDVVFELTDDNTLTVRAKGSAGTVRSGSLVLSSTTLRPFPLHLADARKLDELKDALPDAPDATNLGLGDAAGSVITGTTTNAGATATESETAVFLYALPPSYRDGQPLSLRLRAKVSADRATSQIVDALIKAIGSDGSLGADICATAPQTITTAYADYDFTITPTGLVAGDVLYIEVGLATNDTGGGTDGFPTLSQATVLATLSG